MSQQSNEIQKVINSSITLINCRDDFLNMKKSVDALYEVFKTNTNIDIHEMNKGTILLPTGKAISPSAAAHCLLEMKRTAIFLRGIKKAIDKKINNNGAVKILYAGCGPYATLITPLLILFQAGDLEVTLLDINLTSLDAVKKLITKLGLGLFIQDYILADAADFKVDKDYDIVISETMQSCLQNEPQVAIMQNLIPQIKQDAIFIPQVITIDAYLKKPEKWNDDQILYPQREKKKLNELFTVNRENLNIEKYRKTINIPENIDGYIELMLYTTIVVFDGEVLKENDCSLTIPKKYYEFRERYAGKVEFWYEQGNLPKIECRVLEFA